MNDNTAVSRSWLISLGVTLGLAILLIGIGSVLAQEQGPESDDAAQPQGDASVAATVNSRISYQGVLEEDGAPVDGTRDIDFNFYTNATCTGAAVYETTESDVPINDGLFSVDLDIGQDYFYGQGMWLELEIGGALIGCEEILPVPYALSLRPGVNVQGNMASPSAIIGGSNSGPGFGLYGYGAHAGAAGVGGVAAGEGVGVYGSSPDGVAVYGTSTSGAGGYFYSFDNEALYVEAENPSWGQPAARIRSGGRGAALVATSVEGDAVNGRSIDGRGGDFYSANGTPIRGSSPSGDYLLELWGPTDREFRVESDGDVYADGGYHCGPNYTGTASGGAVRETDLDPCLQDNSPADFAEALPAVDGLEPGDVLAIGPDGDLIRSREPHAANVVGVHSTRPSFLGNAGMLERGGHVPLALVGVVPVKASAENGPIGPGDLLVSSATPGHAMKADPDPAVGTVIGKALQGLDEGIGVIRMLVMLQ